MGDPAMRRLLAAIGRFLDGLFPRPPDESDFPATEDEAAERLRQMRRRRLEKRGHGGNG
jgi:hypothetical protein